MNRKRTYIRACGTEIGRYTILYFDAFLYLDFGGFETYRVFRHAERFFFDRKLHTTFVTVSAPR